MLRTTVRAFLRRGTQTVAALLAGLALVAPLRAFGADARGVVLLPCVGDCDGNGVVMVNELIRGVEIALGNADVEECPAFDVNEDGMVTLNELIAAVNSALSGCIAGEPSPTPSDTPVAPTATSTPATSDTPDATATRTAVGTPTGTPTPAATDTPRSTATVSATRTATGPTATRTRTGTVTQTGTITQTPSRTLTPSRTGTGTQTPTVTRTRPATRTGTRTETPSITRTPSRTGSPTRTRTGSITPNTQTPTRTGQTPGTPGTPGTPTRTATITRTPAPGTRTQTGTRTATGTRTKTGTRTSSPTATTTRTGTPTRSLTPTRTITGTRTTTGTRTGTPTRTAAPSTRTLTPSRTGTPTRTITRTPSITPTFQIIGPTVTYMGLARADGQPVPSAGTAPDGTRIFERQVAQGFFVIVEVREGMSRLPPATSTFNSNPNDPNTLPAFQIFPSRALGNGSAAICDDGPSPPPGGVPAVNPPMFGGSQESANAINDLACRFSARINPMGEDACTRNAFQEASFVSPQSKMQFCPVVGIGSEIAFPIGDTRLFARVLDVAGQPGMPASIIVRVLP